MGVCVEGLRLPWPADLWPELCALGQRCMATDPAQRPGFREVEAALIGIEEALRVRAGPGAARLQHTARVAAWAAGP